MLLALIRPFTITLLVIFFQPLVAAQAEAKCSTQSGQAAGHVASHAGKFDLKSFKARIELPSGWQFIDAKDAKRIARTSFGHNECEIRNLAGYILPEEGWSHVDKKGNMRGWHISLFYFEGYIDFSDVISTNYDELLYQVRDSHYKANSSRMREGHLPTHIVGWAIPPEADPIQMTSIWSMNIAEGNRPDYDIKLSGVNLGRNGYFHFRMSSPLSKKPERHEIFSKAVAAVQFNKGAEYKDRNESSDPSPKMTIGNIVAHDIKAERAKELTWNNYLGDMYFYTIKLIIFFAVDILVLLTIAALGLIGYFIFGSSSDDDFHFFDEQLEFDL